MKKEIRTEITINAAPAQVWNVLTNFSQYGEWNPFITSLKGDVKAGSMITVRLEQPDAKPMTFKPRVQLFQENQEFRWMGHFLFRGIFDGEHIFELKDNGNGTTTFIQSERFRGILVRFLTKMIDNNTVRGFESMNEKLKQRVEQ